MLLAPAGFAAEIQWLVHDAAERCDGAAGAIEAELSRLAAAWAVSLRELRRALARRHARTFFAYAAHGDFQAAAEHRKAALRLDPRWYVHRSILLFPLRRLLRTWRSRPA